MTGDLFGIDRTGSTPADRAAEAVRILAMLATATAPMTDNDAKFLAEMRARVARYEQKTFVTPRQLFWLRDLKD